MGGVREIVSRYFQVRHGALTIGEIPVRTLVERHGSPVFIYDRAILEKKLALLRSALPRKFSISYSMKANPNPTILEFFIEHGCGLEIASGGEFYQALNAGCSPAQIVFAGPGKTEPELEYVLRYGIGEIHAESVREIERIENIARRLKVRARVAVRVNPTADAQGGAMRMGGKPLPFGVDEESLDEAVKRLCASSSIDFRGLHMFAGTQVLDVEVLVSQYRKGLEIARRVVQQLNRPLTTLDFGGGLGVPYLPHERELDTESLRRHLAELFSEVEFDPCFQETHFIVEPGRYLVSEAGVYATRVIDIKVSRGKKFLVLDGGMNHHLAASGNLGQTIKRNYPVALLNKLDWPPEESVEAVGPLCTPLDVLARNIELPRAEVGDIFGVFHSGAYARAASPLNFLSHPSPPEIWVDASHDSIIRRRGEYEDYLRDVSMPAKEKA